MDSWLENFAHANFRRSSDTAHDLKTPLNVAVLNLELLRMRLRKLSGCDDDEKVLAYTQAIELELRRMGRIFDAFFLLSTPPRSDDAPRVIDLAPLLSEAAGQLDWTLNVSSALPVLTHEVRIREAVTLFFEGASRVMAGSHPSVRALKNADSISVIVEGPAVSGFEPGKVFKFYYSDPDGNPDLSLAVARLIAETYGGALVAADERDNVSIRLSFPLGAE